jgi:hypothetical protein
MAAFVLRNRIQNVGGNQHDAAGRRHAGAAGDFHAGRAVDDAAYTAIEFVRLPDRLAIKRTGELYWNGVAISRAALATNLGALSQQPLAPALEIHAEARVRYALVTEVLAAAHNAAVHQISIAPARD